MLSKVSTFFSSSHPTFFVFCEGKTEAAYVDLLRRSFRVPVEIIKDAILLLSNPCIEYWFVLHYKDTNKELSSAECLALFRSIDADYSKGTFSTAMKKILIDSIEDAANRAKAKDAFSNPSSTIHLLTDEIISKKGTCRFVQVPRSL